MSELWFMFYPRNVSTASMSHHGGRSSHGHGKLGRQDPEKGNVEVGEGEEEEEDPFDTRIKNSGCSNLHYALMVGK